LLVVDDHSRVHLESLPDEPNSDYINANYLDVSLIELCWEYPQFNWYIIVLGLQEEELLYSCTRWGCWV